MEYYPLPPYADGLPSWVARVLRGESNAFKPILDDYRQAVLRCLMSVGCGQPDAEDIAQETFVKLFIKLKDNDIKIDYTLEKPLKNWLITVAMNQVRERWRTRGIPTVSFDPSLVKPSKCATDEPSHEMQQAEVAIAVAKCLAELDPTDELTLRLTLMEDFTRQEVADYLETTPEAVRMRLTRARRKFCDKFAKSHPELIDGYFPNFFAVFISNNQNEGGH